ncbi:coiled-coil domain-containing protein [Methylophaga sp. OBS4]|uniref:coiled-coil domain-containing protein n=1 Tax=Methylophaga sp. OBS4 TaxID=2991935 RepID=UPI00225507C7|nr:hypothetical protein [Methylophaga sp. OBS4]MCX4187728.1 hypothetical protein [Methylophaga sp. OBS4]MCX4187753.1 hypothetical protein [Methylophaga sp. OBS4]
MNRLFKYRHTASALAVAATLALPANVQAQTADATELETRVSELEQELAQTRAQLKAAQAGESKAKEQLATVEAASAKATAEEASAKSDKIAFDLFGGTLNVGGAIRANFAVGDYGDSASGAPSRAWGDDGNFELDTYRINMDYANGPILGKLEYRWYNGYNFLHTGWLGYQFDDDSQLQVGVNRVPFGPGPYGIAQSWFFDQHYYVGLADDMDLGVKYSTGFGDWAFDVAYYYADEGHYSGGSHDSSRYSYDVVNESDNGYEERNQFNLRGIYSLNAAIPTDLGFSLQYGQLDSKGAQDDGDAYAGSLHMVNKLNNFTLATQITYYNFDVDSAQPLGTDDLVQFGAYDFPNTVAAEGWIPAISLSYYKATPNIAWLDYVIPYIEYSTIVKEESSFNDSELVNLGAAWASGGWYIYTDLSFSNGNEFIGGDTAFGDRLGANADDDWQTRFNINFGYYF